MLSLCHSYYLLLANQCTLMTVRETAETEEKTQMICIQSKHDFWLLRKEFQLNSKKGGGCGKNG